MANPLNPADYHRVGQSLRGATARDSEEIPEEVRRLRRERQELVDRLRQLPETEDNQRLRSELQKTIRQVERELDSQRAAAGLPRIFD